MTVRFVASLALACGLAATTAVMQTPITKTASVTERATIHGHRFDGADADPQG